MSSFGHDPSLVLLHPLSPSTVRPMHLEFYTV